MSRRHRAEERIALPDPKYGNITVTKLMNQVMQDGNKSAAEKVVYGAFEDLEGKLKKSPVECFLEAMENVMPEVEVRSRRVGGATYQVPMEVRQKRRQALGIRWIVDAAKKRKDKQMRQRLMNEIMDALNNTGSAVKKREDTHKMAEANRAFAHFRW